MADLKADSGSLLINAVRAGDLDAVKKLTHSHGLRCCESGHRDYFLLFIAVTLGRTEIVKFLLQEGARFDCEADGVAETLMHFAAKERDEKLVCALAEKNVPIDAGDEFNQTALHVAAHKGYKETVEVLLKNNARVNVLTKSGYTPLQLAIFDEHREVIDVIEGHYESLLDVTDEFSDESDEKDDDVIKDTIYKDDVNEKDEFSDEKDDDVIKDTIFKDDVNEKDEFSDESDKEDDDVIKDDIYKDDVDEGAIKKDDVHNDEISKLVSHIITHEEYVKLHSLNDIIGGLFGRGFLLNSKYVTESLLLKAIENEYTALIEEFSKIGHPYDVEHSVLLLRIAIKEGRGEIIDRFLKSNVTDVEGDNSISKEDEWIKLLQLLIAKGIKINTFPNLLHLAVQDEFVKVCKLLIANGVDVDAATAHGRTPLHLCCQKRRKTSMPKNDEIIALLLNSGANVSSKDKDGLTAFHQAVVHQLESAIHVFLNSGVDVNLLAKDCSTPLHLASKSNCLQVAIILCENGANVNARQEDGLTPLHLAGSECMVKMLLQYGADIDTKGNENQTVLHYAVSHTDKEHRVEVVRVLLENGVDISEETNGDAAIDLIYSEAKLKNSWDYCLGSTAKKIVDILKRHAIKLETAGLYVHEMYFDLFEDSFKKKLSGFRQECKKEVKRLKKEKLSQQFALHNILTMRKNPTYTRNESLMQSLESYNFEQFPIYESLLKNTREKSQSRLELILSGRKWLGILVKASRTMSGNSVLPDEMLEEIVSYLSDSELKSFISCGEALKDKLKQ